MKKEKAKSALGSLAGKVYVCENCGRKSRIIIGKELKCSHCKSKKLKPVRRPY